MGQTAGPRSHCRITGGSRSLTTDSEIQPTYFGLGRLQLQDVKMKADSRPSKRAALHSFTSVTSGRWRRLRCFERGRFFART